MLMMRPQPRAFMAGASACVRKNGALRCKWICVSQLAGVTSANGSRKFTPAALTRMSTGPIASASRAASCTAAGVRQIARHGVVPECRERAAAQRPIRQLSARRAMSTTRAPARPKRLGHGLAQTRAAAGHQCRTSSSSQKHCRSPNGALFIVATFAYAVCRRGLGRASSLHRATPSRRLPLQSSTLNLTGCRRSKVSPGKYLASRSSAVRACASMPSRREMRAVAKPMSRAASRVIFCQVKVLRNLCTDSPPE